MVRAGKEQGQSVGFFSLAYYLHGPLVVSPSPQGPVGLVGPFVSLEVVHVPSLFSLLQHCLWANCRKLPTMYSCSCKSIPLNLVDFLLTPGTQFTVIVIATSTRQCSYLPKNKNKTYHLPLNYVYMHWQWHPNDSLHQRPSLCLFWWSVNWSDVICIIGTRFA